MRKHSDICLEPDCLREEIESLREKYSQQALALKTIEDLLVQYGSGEGSEAASAVMKMFEWLDERRPSWKIPDAQTKEK